MYIEENLAMAEEGLVNVSVNIFRISKNSYLIEKKFALRSGARSYQVHRKYRFIS
jgi:hypothetical protein